jgi:hypothetical protein
MDDRPIAARRIAPTLLAAIVIVCGCAGPGRPSSAPPAASGASASAAPRATAAQRESPAPATSGGPAEGSAATPIPWPGLAISGTSTTDPIQGTLVTLDDPSVSMRMPTDWQQHTTAEVRAYVVSVLDVVPTKYRTYYDQFLARIDAGDFRFFMNGPSGIDGVTATITVEVGPPHDGQPDAVTELETESRELGTPRDIEHLAWQTVLGPGVLATGVLEPPADIPSVTTRTVLLVVPLPDGRMWTLRGTGPEASTTFVGTVGTVIRSIARPFFTSAPVTSSRPDLAGDPSARPDVNSAPAPSPNPAAAG